MSATPAQLKLLRTLAMRTGQSFTPPSSGAAADREIKRLLDVSEPSAEEREGEREQLAQDLDDQRGGSTRVRAQETTGYGSNARWHGR